MIKEEFVTFESAKLLKEAGFPQDGLYACNTKSYNDDILKTMYLKPTQAQAMRWLREEYNLHVDVSPAKGVTWSMWLIGLKEDGLYNMQDVIKTLEDMPTYEAAVEAGIQAACEYLIEKGGEG